MAAMVVTVITFVVSQLFVGLLFGVFFGLVGWDDAQIDRWLDLPYAQFLLVFASSIATIGVLWFFLRARKSGFGMLGFTRKPQWRDLLSIIGGFIVYFGLFVVAAIIAGQLFGINTGQEQEIGFESAKAGGNGLLWVFLSLVILPPLVEETLFRGFLFGSLRTKMTLPWAIVVTSVLFAVPHLFASSNGLLWIAAVDTLVLSVVLCYVREKTGALWASIGIHAIKNCLAFVVIFVV